METFATRLRQLLDQRGVSQRQLARIASYDPGHMSKILNGRRQPTAELARKLEEALDAPGELVPLVPKPAPSGEDTPAVASAAKLRRRMTESLNATVTTTSTIDHWRAVADGFGRTYRLTPPALFLQAVTRELGDLAELMTRPLLSPQRRGLCHSAARMAGLLATALVNLGDYREARAWFQTAYRAAEESEDTALQAWVLVRHAVSALYWGDPAGAVDFAGRAGALAQGRPCVAEAWAPAVLARACAHVGQRAAALGALVEAESAFGRLDAGPNEQAAYGYTAAQLHFYRSNTLTLLRDQAAYAAQDAALDHYGPGEYLDASLVRVDRAMCLASDGQIEEAAAYVTDLVTALPPEHRSPIVLSRARELATAIPVQRRSLPAVRDFQEVLQLPAAKT